MWYFLHKYRLIIFHNDKYKCYILRILSHLYRFQPTSPFIFNWFKIFLCRQAFRHLDIRINKIFYDVSFIISMLKRSFLIPFCVHIKKIIFITLIFILKYEIA